MFDYDLLEKCCVYKNNTLSWLTEEIHPVVYMLRIGNGNYIGSTYNIKNRITNYVNSLPYGKYKAKAIQEAYDKSPAIIVYIMERIVTGDIRVREQFYINLISPTLNTAKYVSSDTPAFIDEHIQNGYFRLRTQECLKEHDITTKAIAQKLGISTYQFNKTMQFPNHDFLYKVARIMDIPLIAFFTSEPYHPQGVYANIGGKTYKLRAKNK